MSDLLAHIVFSGLSCSAAIALVLAARSFVARHFGAPVAYALWTLVPLAALAMLLPARSAFVVQDLPMLPLPAAKSLESVPTMAMSPDAGFDVSFGLSCIWIAGAVATTLIFLWQQLRFLRSLGRLDALHDGLHRAQATHGCPVLVGVWRPRIVVPADFETRYTAAERDLILAHERMHRARGDATANMLATLLRCVFWFNPLAHFAAPRFLADQELACDAVVIARFPNARRAYADALMKTQLGGGRAALACHWFARNVLRERITALTLPAIARSRRRLGSVAVALTVLAASAAAWAVQPAHTQLRYERVAGTESATSIAMIHEQTTGAVAQTALEVPSQRVLEQRLEVPASANRIEQARQKSVASAAQIGNPTTSPVRVASSIQSQRDPTPTPLDVTSQSSTARPVVASSESMADEVRTDSSSADADSPPREIASYRHAPAYPAAAARTHLEGTVVLDVHVDAYGRPVDARVARLAPPTANELASASLAAVTHWQFEPARRGGRAVDGRLDVPFVFALDGQATYAAPEAHRQASYRTVGAADYTPDAKTTDAVVYVRVQIEDDGSVSSSSIERVDPASAKNLGEPALAAVKTWTFNPARDRDKAVASTVIVPIVFGANPQATPAIARIRNLLDPVRVTPKRS